MELLKIFPTKKIFTFTAIVTSLLAEIWPPFRRKATIISHFLKGQNIISNYDIGKVEIMEEPPDFIFRPRHSSY